jgi:hypothetical protein
VTRSRYDAFALGAPTLVDEVCGHAGQYEGHGSEGTPNGGGCDGFGRLRAGACASLRDSVVVAQTSVVVKREGTGGLGDGE